MFLLSRRIIFPFFHVLVCLLNAFHSIKETIVRPTILIAGNFSINGERLNLARYDATTNSLLKQYNAQLFQYSADNAVIYDVTLNSTTDSMDEIYLAGLFDTTSQISQTQLCSVSKFDGFVFEKVGEGLCSRGDISSIVVQTIVAGNGGDLFAGGSFATRLWDGRHFVYVYHVARYDAEHAAWLPLSGGGELKCADGQQAKINTLVWDNEQEVLYMGGRFDILDDKSVSSGVAKWSKATGVSNLEGGGIRGQGSDSSLLGEITTMAFESTSKSLFVAGTFSFLGDLFCLNIAVWDTIRKTWTCLYNDQYDFAFVSTMIISHSSLFIGGMAAVHSSWKTLQDDPHFDNTIAALDLSEYIPSTRKGNRRPLPRSSHSLNWTWLPDFSGVPGPIKCLFSTGEDSTSEQLWIAFDSSNLMEDPNVPSAVLLWKRNSNGKGHTIHSIGGNRFPIQGLVTAVMEVHFPSDDYPIVTPPFIGKDEDYTFFILLSCVVLGAFLGLSVTISCLYRIQDNEERRMQSNPSLNPLMGIPLQTLSGDYANTTDFKLCFERAMKIRHLSTYETLIMINPQEIMLSRIIGEGSFGRVWSGHWRNNAVAVKEFVFAQAAIAGGTLQRTTLIEEIVGEAGMMACLRHPKILQLYGCSITMQAIWIVSELCIRGSLKMMLMDVNNPLTFNQSLSILLDVADGMHYLHQRTPPIIHRDLKSHNIFITETAPGKYIAKIGDWGSARAVALSGSKSMTHGVGTACWLSPEVINNAHFSKASDVYAFGMILWEVHTRQEIYEGLSAAQIIAKVAHEGLRPNVPRDCPWSKIMIQCWKQDPSHRPSFDNILNTLGKLQHKHQMLQQHVHRSRERDKERSAEKSFGADISNNHVSKYSNELSEHPQQLEAKKIINKLDSFHPSLENIELGLMRNKEESFAHHLAPEIAILHTINPVMESDQDEPPDPLDFVFQNKNKSPSRKN